MTTYATDGKCHNANHGTFGHECGKPATWIAVKPHLSDMGAPMAHVYRVGFCDECKEHGDERHGVIRWEPMRRRDREMVVVPEIVL